MNSPVRRGLALIRVSKVGDRGDDLVSPDIQRAAIVNYAQAHRIQIIEWIEVLDSSGSQTRSRWWATLDEAISRVETERLDTIVAWKFSRVSRHRLKWAVALDRVEKVGATLESATEGVDTTTSTGRFTRGMLAELSAFQADQIGDVWREVKARRVSLGLADGQPRFGYRIEDGQYVPDEWAPTLTSLYEQRVGGVSNRQLAMWLRDQGGSTRYGNPYTPQGLSRMLHTGFGAGLLYVKGQWVPAAHEAVVSPDLWRAYLSTAATQTPARGERHELSGLLRCAYCGKWLHAAPRKGWPAGTLWVCTGRVKFGTCVGGAGWGPKITRLLSEWVEGIVAGTDAEYQAALRAQPRRGVTQVRRRLLAIEDDLLTIARKNQRGFYDDQTYLLLRAELLDEQRLLTKQMEEFQAPKAPPKDTFTALLALDGAERNGAWKTVVSHVTVRNNERPKYEIVPRWRVI